jgi:competence protein ComEA
MKDQIQSYFKFSKKELNGILILIILVALVFAVPYLFRALNEPQSYDLSKFKEEIASFKESAIMRPNNYHVTRAAIEDTELKPEYFNFNPNGLSETDWQKLGLSLKQAKVIRNYQAKGGKFYKKEDLKRIYSITEKQYQKLEPYIQIATQNTRAVESVKYQPFKKEYTAIKRELIVVELNAADSVMMESIRGVGPAFASRIIRFRNRLGGFYSKEQLKEVYGLDSLKYSQLSDQVTVDVSLVQRININSATFEELKKHPYLNYKQMNAILQYRKQHGNFQSANDLKKVLILNDEIIRKIEPYLSF